jgi:hypothetical protein
MLTFELTMPMTFGPFSAVLLTTNVFSAVPFATHPLIECSFGAGLSCAAAAHGSAKANAAINANRLMVASRIVSLPRPCCEERPFDFHFQLIARLHGLRGAWRAGKDYITWLQRDVTTGIAHDVVGRKKSRVGVVGSSVNAAPCAGR